MIEDECSGLQAHGGASKGQRYRRWRIGVAVDEKVPVDLEAEGGDVIVGEHLLFDRLGGVQQVVLQEEVGYKNRFLGEWAIGWRYGLSYARGVRGRPR